MYASPSVQIVLRTLHYLFSHRLFSSNVHSVGALSPASRNSMSPDWLMNSYKSFTLAEGKATCQLGYACSACSLRNELRTATNRLRTSLQFEIAHLKESMGLNTVPVNCRLYDDSDHRRNTLVAETPVGALRDIRVRSHQHLLCCDHK